MDRRNWLSRTALSTTGLVIMPHLGIAMPKVDSGETYLRLASNENPYGCSKKVMDLLQASGQDINRYAFAWIPVLKDHLAKRFDLLPENILLGAGSSGLLEAVAQFMLQNGGDVTAATPTFAILPDMLARFGTTSHHVPLTHNHLPDLDAMLAKTKTHPGLVYIVNPNNPTGTAIPPNELRVFINEAVNYSYVLVDEAYLEFADQGESMIDLIAHPKVMVIKTFSKAYGLAGLRVGYGFAHETLAKALEKHMIFAGLPIASPAFQAVTIALEDQDFVDFVVQKNKESKVLVEETLSQLNIEYIPSQTSFILFNIDDYDGDFMMDMKANGVLIGTRNYLDKTWCRVSMGTVDETLRFTKVLQKLWNV